MGGDEENGTSLKMKGIKTDCYIMGPAQLSPEASSLAGTG